MTHTVSETLNKAADLIEERGWVGSGGQGWHVGGNDPLCIEGAIKAALGWNLELGFTQVNTCPAGVAVREHLEMGAYDGVRTALFLWNDMRNYVDGEMVPARNAEQVIETLRAASVIAAAREEAAIVAAATEVDVTWVTA